jgi:hypothetical protein
MWREAWLFLDVYRVGRHRRSCVLQEVEDEMSESIGRIVKVWSGSRSLKVGRIACLGYASLRGGREVGGVRGAMRGRSTLRSATVVLMGLGHRDGLQFACCN